jgi:hypothetical protein
MSLSVCRCCLCEGYNLDFKAAYKIEFLRYALSDPTLKKGKAGIKTKYLYTG